MEKQSAIMQMYLGQRGHYESIPMSEEYKRCLEKVIKHDDEMRKQLKKFPELLENYDKLTYVLEELEGIASDDHYYEGFSFGLLMGIEVASTGLSKNGE